MDKLEAVRIAARNLDRCADEELLARTASGKAKARARMIEAEREYARALDALHDCGGKTTESLDCRSLA